ncbi:DNA polymerase III subunit alpha, partial [candidate division KSB1 bacterium]|nr:DNA polymerase III subunit alpha [candidate division KSB1 bacterium]
MMFIHLNTHSYYSFCRGVDSIEKMCAAAKERGMNQIALTDTNGIYGLIWFLQIAKEMDITPIIGTEIVYGDSRAIVLVKNREGYANMCRILSQMHLDTENCFSISHSVSRNSAGLIVLSDSIAVLNRLKPRISPENLYVELQPGPQRTKLLEYARQNGLQPVATNNVHFVDADGFKLHYLLRAIDKNTAISRLAASDIVRPTAWLKSPHDMAASFPDCPEALENTVKIGEQCMYDLDFGGTIFPKLKTNSHKSTFDYLKHKTYEGASRRYNTIDERIRKRLEYELKIIRDKGFAPYFLVVEDIVRQSPRTCGRGSAAASIVSYCLGITHVDPIEHDLFFERFLNPGRIDPPDIDVDFPWDERDAILDYVFQKYGKKNSAMISNHVTFKARAAVREIAKVYGLPAEEIKTVTEKLSGFWRADRVSDVVQNHPAYRGMRLEKPWQEIIEQAQKLDGIPRNLSVHCGGVIITPEPTEDYCPVQRMPKGVNVIQWEKDQAEDAGLVKMDLLGNRSLAVIRDAISAIKRNYNIDINYETWNPLYDKESQRLIREGDTIGVFYIESPAMRLLQKKSNIGDFEHLVIHSSLIRPAANDYIVEYLRRLHGAPYTPLHPLLGEILKETYGIMCYQEDVSKVAMALAGFDAVEADQLRKILSKKRIGKTMLDFKEKFYKGARRNGVDDETIEKIWDMIMSFTGYSFCKPHSASYALVSFKSCYLRAHYPAEFMAAVISNQGGYYSAFAYISEARRMGLVILLPDINDSEWEYTGYSRRLQVGFMQLKGIRRETVNSILEERKKRPYRNFNEFLKRVNPDPNDVRILIKAGVFDQLEPEMTRPELMWQLSLKYNK